MSMSLVTPIESNGTETVTAAFRYPKEIAEQVAADFAETAIERDRQGGHRPTRAELASAKRPLESPHP